MRTVLTMAMILTLATSIPVLGQITISTNTFQPAVGTVLTSKVDTSIDATFFNSLLSGSGGPLQWDFTGQTYTLESRATVVSTAATPAIATFSDANLVMRISTGADTVWSILRSEPSLFWQLGIVAHSSVGGEFVIAYQDSTPDYVFPISNSSQWDSHRLWTQVSGGNIHTDIYDSAHYDVDAWGTAIYGSNVVPVLRVVESQHSTYLTYAGEILVSTTVTDVTTVNFIGAGFDQVVSASRVASQFDTTYSSTASGDFLGTPTDVHEDKSNSLPTAFGVEQNYPNPFNPRTEIRFSVPVRSTVRLAVYNLAGQEVKVLVDKQMGAGSYVADWDGTSSSGEFVASGVYLYRITAGSFTGAKKMVLLK